VALEPVHQRALHRDINARRADARDRHRRRRSRYALAETTIGLYKTECVRDGSPFRDGPLESLADVEQITSAWVCWYNTSRLMHRLGRRPPAEAEAGYYDHHRAGRLDQAHT
jgi:transposase InsO family protein